MFSLLFQFGDRAFSPHPQPKPRVFIGNPDSDILSWAGGKLKSRSFLFASLAWSQMLQRGNSLAFSPDDNSSRIAA